MIEAQEVIEVALAAAARDGAVSCIVLVDETSHADVRFAPASPGTCSQVTGQAVG